MALAESNCEHLELTEEEYADVDRLRARVRATPGACLQKVKPSGRPLLHVLCSRGLADHCATVLEICPASVLILDAKGRGPLHAALRAASVNIASMLFCHGAVAEITDIDGINTFHLLAETKGTTFLFRDACVSVHPLRLATLLRGRRESDGGSPLHVACTAGNISVAFLIAKFVGGLEIPDARGRTPRALAPVSMVEMLDLTFSRDASESVQFGISQEILDKNRMTTTWMIKQAMLSSLGSGCDRLGALLSSSPEVASVDAFFVAWLELWRDPGALRSPPYRTEALARAFQIMTRLLPTYALSPTLLSELPKLAQDSEMQSVRELFLATKSKARTLDEFFVSGVASWRKFRFGLPIFPIAGQSVAISPNVAEVALNSIRRRHRNSSDSDSDEGWGQKNLKFDSLITESDRIALAFLLTEDPICIASELTALFMLLTYLIRPEHLRPASCDSNKSEMLKLDELGWPANPLVLEMSLFNNLSSWVQRCVLSCGTDDLLTEVVTRLLDLANIFRKSKNFQCAFAISGGLSHSSLRLSRWLREAGSGIAGVVEDLVSLASPLRKFCNYRNAIEELEPPYVPFTAVSIGPMAQAFEAYSLWEDPLETAAHDSFSVTAQEVPMLNFARLRTIYAGYSELRKSCSNSMAFFSKYSPSSMLVEKLSQILSLPVLLLEEIEVRRSSMKIARRSHSRRQSNASSSHSSLSSSSSSITAARKTSFDEIGEASISSRLNQSPFAQRSRRGSALAQSSLDTSPSLKFSFSQELKISDGNLVRCAVDRLLHQPKNGFCALELKRIIALPWGLLCFMHALVDTWSRLHTSFFSLFFQAVGHALYVDDSVSHSIDDFESWLVSVSTRYGFGRPRWLYHLGSVRNVQVWGGLHLSWDISGQHSESMMNNIILMVSGAYEAHLHMRIRAFHYLLQPMEGETTSQLCYWVAPETHMTHSPTCELSAEGYILDATDCSDDKLFGVRYISEKSEATRNPYLAEPVYSDGHASIQSTQAQKSAALDLRGKEGDLLLDFEPMNLCMLMDSAGPTGTIEDKKFRQFLLLPTIALRNGVMQWHRKLGTGNMAAETQAMSVSFIFGEILGRAVRILQQSAICAPVPLTVSALAEIELEMFQCFAGLSLGQISLYFNASESQLFPRSYNVKHSPEAQQIALYKVDHVYPVCMIATGFISGYLHCALSGMLDPNTVRAVKILRKEFGSLIVREVRCKACERSIGDCTFEVSIFEK